MHLHHVTITTGHSRRSYRSEVGAEALAATRRLLDAAIERGRVALPIEPSGCELQATAEGRCLVCTVWHDEAPLVTFGVAGHSRCGAGLWRTLITSATGPARGDPNRPPEAPWCAARIEPGLLLMMDTATIWGDLERCIAHAWLDRLGARE